MSMKNNAESFTEPCKIYFLEKKNNNVVMSASRAGQFPLYTLRKAQCITLFHNSNTSSQMKEFSQCVLCHSNILFPPSTKNFTTLKIFDINQDFPNLKVVGDDSSTKRHRQLAVYTVHAVAHHPMGLLFLGFIRFHVGLGWFKCEDFTQYPFQLSIDALTPCFSALAADSQLRMLRICWFPALLLWKAD